MEPKPKTMSMRELYRQVRHYTEVGIEGYNLIKKYEDPAAAIRSRENSTFKKKIKQLKRGSYLQDQEYAKKDIPGVCTYNISEKQRPKSKFNKHPDKKTYLDQAIQISEKNNIPAPGYYNVLQSMGERLLSVSQAKQQHSVSAKKLDKITYLDNAEWEGSLTPGVGEYFIERGMRSKTQSTSSLGKNPQFWKQYHQELQRKKEEKLKNQGPDVGTYHPKPTGYELFDQKKKLTKAESQIKLARLKPGRFRTEQKIEKKAAQLGPGKYNIVNDWAPKQRNKKGVLSIISKAPAPSIYYH